jgi:23S rRNA (cytidine1920-2'-O)/16S rRNA (cytidine1409-2'-O)-methyltransferase
VAKLRLDQLLVERKLADSRAKAQMLIASGVVYTDEFRLDKPGHKVADDTALAIRQAEIPYVSRGGLKLAHAIKYFSIQVVDKICLDVGASTGGFTDVLLRQGARKIYAVDVGHGQLDRKLKQDTRVVSHEKINARYLDEALIPEAPELVVCDASFISLKLVLPAALSLAAKDAVVIALIKPQFEVGKGRVGKGGVVRNEALHQEVCGDINDWLNGLNDWCVLGITESPIKGPNGNTEFLIAAKKD